MRRGNQVLSKIRPQVVQVCRVWCLVDMKSFCNPSMGEVWYNFFHFGRLPFHLVSRFPSLYCNAILVVVLLHYRFVFGESLPQCSSCFTDVHVIALSTRYFVNNSLLV